METNTKRDAGQEGTKEQCTATFEDYLENIVRCHLTLGHTGNHVGGNKNSEWRWSNVPVSAPVPPQHELLPRIHSEGSWGCRCGITVSFAQDRESAIESFNEHVAVSPVPEPERARYPFKRPARKDELGTIETVLFRRALQRRLDGYTLETATEILAALKAPVAPQASPEAPAKEMSNDPRVIVTYIWSEVETGTYAQAETILEAYVEQRMARARLGLSGRAE